MVGLLDTLGKFLISLASVFPQGIVTLFLGTGFIIIQTCILVLAHH